jgi:hypothetical protein
MLTTDLHVLVQSRNARFVGEPADHTMQVMNETTPSPSTIFDPAHFRAQ